jgi:hypothetical protein
MEKKIFETRLEKLLMNKAFNNLSSEEKKYVLTFLTEEEYQEYAFMLSNYKPALFMDYDKLQPAPKVTEALAHSFRAKNNVVNLHIPAYFNFTRSQGLLTAAAALLILIGSVFILRHVNEKKQLLTVKTNRLHLIDHSISNASKKEVREMKYHSFISGKRKAHFYAHAVKKVDDNLCLTIPVTSANTLLIDSLNIPCLNPMNTMVIIPEANSLPGLNLY